LAGLLFFLTGGMREDYMERTLGNDEAADDLDEIIKRDSHAIRLIEQIRKSIETIDQAEKRRADMKRDQARELVIADFLMTYNAWVFNHLLDIIRDAAIKREDIAHEWGRLMADQADTYPVS